MRKALKLIVLLAITFCFASSVSAASNPYGKYQSLYGITTIRCTWYAWQQAYEHTGVALPSWGNAQTWYNSAINDGYKVGSEAKPNSIAVWSSSDGYGHVGFVVSVSGNIMTVNEAGIVTDENEGIVNGSHKYTTAENLIGFIYLDEAPTKNNSSNNSTTNTKTNNTASNNSPKKEESSNTNLNSLTIDIEGFEFKEDTLEYKLEVDYRTEIIHISASAEDDKAIVTGAGAKALKIGENNYSIIITAEDGTTKEYKITITRDEPLIVDHVETKIEDDPLMNYLIIGIISGGIILGTIIIILIIKKGKKKKATRSSVK